MGLNHSKRGSYNLEKSEKRQDLKRFSTEKAISFTNLTEQQIYDDLFPFRHKNPCKMKNISRGLGRPYSVAVMEENNYDDSSVQLPKESISLDLNHQFKPIDRNDNMKSEPILNKECEKFPSENDDPKGISSKDEINQNDGYVYSLEDFPQQFRFSLKKSFANVRNEPEIQFVSDESKEERQHFSMQENISFKEKPSSNKPRRFSCPTISTEAQIFNINVPCCENYYFRTISQGERSNDLLINSSRRSSLSSGMSDVKFPASDQQKSTNFQIDNLLNMTSTSDHIEEIDPCSIYDSITSSEVLQPNEIQIINDWLARAQAECYIREQRKKNRPMMISQNEDFTVAASDSMSSFNGNKPSKVTFDENVTETSYIESTESDNSGKNPTTYRQRNVALRSRSHLSSLDSSEEDGESVKLAIRLKKQTIYSEDGYKSSEENTDESEIEINDKMELLMGNNVITAESIEQLRSSYQARLNSEDNQSNDLQVISENEEEDYSEKISDEKYENIIFNEEQFNNDYAPFDVSFRRINSRDSNHLEDRIKNSFEQFDALCQSENLDFPIRRNSWKEELKLNDSVHLDQVFIGDSDADYLNILDVRNLHILMNSGNERDRSYSWKNDLVKDENGMMKWSEQSDFENKLEDNLKRIDEFLITKQLESKNYELYDKHSGTNDDFVLINFKNETFENYENHNENTTVVSASDKTENSGKKNPFGDLMREFDEDNNFIKVQENIRFEALNSVLESSEGNAEIFTKNDDKFNKNDPSNFQPILNQDKNNNQIFKEGLKENSTNIILPPKPKPRKLLKKNIRNDTHKEIPNKPSDNISIQVVKPKRRTKIANNRDLLKNDKYQNNFRENCSQFLKNERIFASSEIGICSNILPLLSTEEFVQKDNLQFKSGHETQKDETTTTFRRYSKEFKEKNIDKIQNTTKEEKNLTRAPELILSGDPHLEIDIYCPEKSEENIQIQHRSYANNFTNPSEIHKHEKTIRTVDESDDEWCPQKIGNNEVQKNISPLKFLSLEDEHYPVKFNSIENENSELYPVFYNSEKYLSDIEEITTEIESNVSEDNGDQNYDCCNLLLDSQLIDFESNLQFIYPEKFNFMKTSDLKEKKIIPSSSEDFEIINKYDISKNDENDKIPDSIISSKGNDGNNVRNEKPIQHLPSGSKDVAHQRLEKKEIELLSAFNVNTENNVYDRSESAFSNFSEPEIVKTQQNVTYYSKPNSATSKMLAEIDENFHILKLQQKTKFSKSEMDVENLTVDLTKLKEHKSIDRINIDKRSNNFFSDSEIIIKRNKKESELSNCSYPTKCKSMIDISF